jgi:ABC-2 type transport system permease protein
MSERDGSREGEDAVSGDAPHSPGAGATRISPAAARSAGAAASTGATPPHGSIWAVAGAIAWRGIHTYLRRPDLAIPSLIFPLVFLASFAGGLSALGEVPGFHFPAGYTAFQFVFVLCQSAMFSGLFTGFTLAFDFEGGFARRLMLAASDRRGIALGYALVALTRACITLTVVTLVALIAGMQITGDGVDIVGLYGLAALLVLVGYGWAAGVAFRFRTIQAGPLMQTPVFLILFLAPVFVPLSLLRGWIHAVASVNPATAFLDAGRGLISGVHDHTLLAYVCAVGLIALFVVWTLSGLRAAERSP